MRLFHETENKKQTTHSGASEDMAMVEMGEGLNNEFSGEISDGNSHVPAGSLESGGRDAKEAVVGCHQ